MKLETLAEAILHLIDVIDYFVHWRLTLCVLGSMALAWFVVGKIEAEPLRWLVAGAIVVPGFIIGYRWDRAHH